MEKTLTIAGREQVSPSDPFRALRASFGVDTRSLAALRISLGSILLADLALRARHLAAHYSDFGVLPRSELRFASLHALGGSPAWAGALFVLAAIFAAMLLAGWRTRLATAASWALLVSLHLRNPYICDAGDKLLALILFWGLFLPLGAHASTDALRRGGARNAPEVVLSPASVALLFQVVFVYMFSALIKDKSLWVGSGDAIYYALHVDMVTTPAGRALLEWPSLLRLASRGTFVLELLGPLLCFVPVGVSVLRTIVPLVFMAFHALLAVCLDIGLFPYVCMAAWLAFLPPGFWDALASRRAGPSPAARSPAAASRTSLVAGALAASAFLYVFFWNVATLRPGSRLPAALAWPGEQLRLGQRWAMFSAPPRDDGWWVMLAVLRDGTEVDLFTGASPPTWEKPRDVRALYESPRLWKWLTFVWGAEHRPLIAHHAAWLRRDWEKRHGPGRAVVSQTIHYMLEETRPPGEEPGRAKLTVYEWSDSAGERVWSPEETLSAVPWHRPL